MRAGQTEDRPFRDALGVVAHALEVLRDHEQLGQMRRVGIPLANEVDHHLFSALIKRVDLVVGSEYLFGAIAVGVSEALERSLDHISDLARRRGDLGLDRGCGLMGNLGCQIGYVARLRIDVRQVAHQAKRPRNVAQVVGDEGLLHEHDVEARVLDRRTKATHAHLTRDDLLGSLCVALRKRKTSRRHVRSDVDFVLTFEEVLGMFTAKGVDKERIPMSEAKPLNQASTDARKFAVTGGVAQAVVNAIHKTDPDREVKVVSATGLKECRKLLMLAKAGKYNGYLIEGMACPGGCVAGAGTLARIDKSAKEVEIFASRAEFSCATETEYADYLPLVEAAGKNYNEVSTD